MATRFKDNYLYIDVEGYSVKPRDVKSASSNPLFSWRYDCKEISDLHWGCQRFEYPHRSFWLTELYVVSGTRFSKQYIPGAWLDLITTSKSYKTWRYCWRNINDRYTFKDNEIDPQENVRKFLRSIINEHTVVFYKGGYLEKNIAALCHAKESVNIENLGCRAKVDFSNGPVVPATCKVHKNAINHCPLQEVNYFIQRTLEWLPKYEYNTILTAKNFPLSVKLQDEEETPARHPRRQWVEVEDEAPGWETRIPQPPVEDTELGCWGDCWERETNTPLSPMEVEKDNESGCWEKEETNIPLPVEGEEKDVELGCRESERQSRDGEKHMESVCWEERETNNTPLPLEEEKEEEKEKKSVCWESWERERETNLPAAGER